MKEGVFALVCIGLLGFGLAQEGGFVQEDAHEHGAALLTLVLDGETLSMELESPAVNFVGFEYEPTTDEQVQAVEGVLAELEDPMTLFTPAEAASCELVSAEAEHLMTDEEGHADEHGDEHSEDEDHSNEEGEEDEGHGDEKHDEERSQHSEFRAAYSFACSDPNALSSVDLSELFAMYPGIEDLDVQYVLPSGQGAAELSADSTELTF